MWHLFSSFYSAGGPAYNLNFFCDRKAHGKVSLFVLIRSHHQPNRSIFIYRQSKNLTPIVFLKHVSFHYFYFLTRTRCLKHSFYFGYARRRYDWSRCAQLCSGNCSRYWSIRKYRRWSMVENKVSSRIDLSLLTNVLLR